jgi:hypothetical protein
MAQAAEPGRRETPQLLLSDARGHVAARPLQA